MENITREAHPQLPPIPPAQPPGTVIAPGGSVSQAPIQTPTPATNVITPAQAPAASEVITPAPQPVTVAVPPVQAAPPAPAPVAAPIVETPPAIAQPQAPTSSNLPGQVIQPQTADVVPSPVTETAVITPVPVTPSITAQPVAPPTTIVSPSTTPSTSSASPQVLAPSWGTPNPQVFNNKKFRFPFNFRLPVRALAVAIVVVLVVAGGAYALKGRKRPQTVGSATNTSASSPATGSSSASQSATNTPHSTSNLPNPTASSAPSTAQLPDYEQAIQRFITAIQTNDKATADSLQSPPFTQALQQLTGTTSFYDACQSSGNLCSSVFDPKSLAAATKVSKEYVAPDGTKGQEDDFTFPANSSVGTNPDGSLVTATIVVVPNGSSWQVYRMVEGGIAIN